MPQPQSSKPTEPHKIELDRKKALLAKVRTLGESIARNRGAVQGMKPDKSYVWVNTNESRQTFYQGLGYVLCKDPDIKTQWRREDGTHRRGDLILYEIDKELREVMDYDQELRAIEGIEGPRQQFKDFGAQHDVPVYEIQERR